MVDPNAYEELPLLHPEAVKKGMEELQKDYKGGSVLREIEGALNQFCNPRQKGEQGILLYGPPGKLEIYTNNLNVNSNEIVNYKGTGKTKISSDIAMRVGLTEVSPPLASSELNRSLVGETERILIDLFERPKLVFPLFEVFFVI